MRRSQSRDTARAVKRSAQGMRNWSTGRPDIVPGVVTDHVLGNLYRFKRDHWPGTILVRNQPGTAPIPIPQRMDAYCEGGSRHRMFVRWQPYGMQERKGELYTWPCLGSSFGGDWSRGSGAVDWESWGNPLSVSSASAGWRANVSVLAAGDNIFFLTGGEDYRRLVRVDLTEQPDLDDWEDGITPDALLEVEMTDVADLCLDDKFIWVLGAGEALEGSPIGEASLWRVAAFPHSLAFESWQASASDGAWIDPLNVNRILREGNSLIFVAMKFIDMEESTSYSHHLVNVIPGSGAYSVLPLTPPVQPSWLDEIFVANVLIVWNPYSPLVDGGHGMDIVLGVGGGGGDW